MKGFDKYINTILGCGTFIYFIHYLYGLQISSLDLGLEVFRLLVVQPMWCERGIHGSLYLIIFSQMRQYCTLRTLISEPPLDHCTIPSLFISHHYHPFASFSTI